MILAGKITSLENKLVLLSDINSYIVFKNIGSKNHSPLSGVKNIKRKHRYMLLQLIKSKEYTSYKADYYNFE